MPRAVTQALLESIRTGFNGRFKEGLNKAAPQWPIIATKVSSSTKTETFGWLGALPIFRKWVGEKRVKTMEELAYILVNEPYEATAKMHKHQVADDNLGIWPSSMSKWGSEAAYWPDRLCWDALAKGNTVACYDGQNFFDVSHPSYQEDGSTYSNMSAAGGSQPWFLVDLSKMILPLIFQEREAPHFDMVTDPNDAEVRSTGYITMWGEARGAAGYTFPQLAYRSTQTLNAANFNAARQAMRDYKDHAGDPMEIEPTHIVLGVSNFQAAEDLFDKANLAGGESNTLNKAVGVIKARRLL